jgi:hypothetical protein
MLDLRNVQPYLARSLPLTPEAQARRGWVDIPLGTDYAPDDPLVPLWLGSGVGLPELQKAIMTTVPPLESVPAPPPSPPMGSPDRGNRLATAPIETLARFFR